MPANYLEFENATQRLAEALAQPKNEFIRDSVIQRFEFCVELAWKSAKKILGLSSTAPKAVIRDMAQQGLIANPDIWFKLLDDRNLSSHTYREDIAESVYLSAKNSLLEFEKLLVELKKYEIRS